MRDTPPKIIFTERPSDGNLNRGTILTLSCQEFINFANIEGIKCVFSAYESIRKIKTYFMFAIKEGFIVNASHQDIEHMISYYDIKSIGSEDFFEFLEIMSYPIIINNEESSKHQELNGKIAEVYRKFQKSNFYGYSQKDFEIYKNALIGGFENKQEYSRAESQGIKNKKEYDKFIKSGYGRYQDYLDALKCGFEDKQLFDNAKQFGILTYKKYKEFTEKGFKDMLDKVVEIETDGEKMYLINQYEQVIQKRYLAVERLLKIIYFKVFNKKISKENDLNLSEIIEGIENKLNIKLNILDELNKWRIKRNEIVHDNLKIEQGMADLANQFFSGCMIKLRAELNKLFNYI